MDNFQLPVTFLACAATARTAKAVKMVAMTKLRVLFIVCSLYWIPFYDLRVSHVLLAGNDCLVFVRSSENASAHQSLSTDRDARGIPHLRMYLTLQVTAS